MTTRGVPVPLAMVVAVAAISSSAILARVAMGDDPGVLRAAEPAAASALAIAFWRCALGAMALAPAAWRSRTPLSATRRRQLLGSGVALGLHFALFQGSLALTTVASAVTLATMSPIFVALGARWFLREPAGRRVLLGLAATVVGAVIIGLGDLAAVDLGRRALVGDVMALCSAVAVAVYLLIGRAARRDTAASTYSASVYGVAAASLLVVAVALQVPLTGFGPVTWLAIGGIVVGPQLLGHTVFNLLLARVSATVVAVVILSEPLGAALLAWWLLTEVPAAAVAVGGPLVLAGVLLAVTGRTHPTPPVGGAPPVTTDRTVDPADGADAGQPNSSGS